MLVVDALSSASMLDAWPNRIIAKDVKSYFVVGGQDGYQAQGSQYSIDTLSYIYVINFLIENCMI